MIVLVAKMCAVGYRHGRDFPAPEPRVAAQAGLMCIAMNGDQLAPDNTLSARAIRNFEGRQGKGGRIVSPVH